MIEVSTGSLDANLFKSSPEGGSESMHLMYLMVDAAAERRIDPSAAYFVPDDIMPNALVAARKRGVRVRILMPGRHMDSSGTRLASKSGWEPLLFADKMLIADRELVSLGSTDFKMRSLQINGEASLKVYDCAFADRMAKIFEEDLERRGSRKKRALLPRCVKEPFVEGKASRETRAVVQIPILDGCFEPTMHRRATENAKGQPCCPFTHSNPFSQSARTDQRL